MFLVEGKRYPLGAESTEELGSEACFLKGKSGRDCPEDPKRTDHRIHVHTVVTYVC